MPSERRVGTRWPFATTSLPNGQRAVPSVGMVIATAAAREAVRSPEGLRTAIADIGAVVERDRRAGAERAIEVGRWVLLTYAAIAANFPTATTRHIQTLNLTLALWGGFNLALTLALITGHVPHRRMQYAMTGVDVAVATVLVTLTGGFGSPFAISFFAVVVASSLRFGLRASVCCALVVSVVDLFAGLAVTGWLSRTQVDTFLSHFLMYLVIAVVSSVLVRELVTARARQMEHTYRLEHAAFIELREVDRLKTEFITLASHELRTPVAKIKAWISLMHDAGGRLSPEMHGEGLAVLQGEAGHLTRLTDNLLCIAQLEAGEIRLKTGPVSVAVVVEHVTTRFVQAADRHRVRVEIAPQTPLVLADRERLSLALACLVDNALKFGPESEVVTLAARPDGTAVRIEVRDLGMRIPDDQRERIFRSFHQVEAPLTRQRGGAGVGLYLARQLVERMGGSVWVDNTRSRGNVFGVTLPADV